MAEIYLDIAYTAKIANLPFDEKKGRIRTFLKLLFPSQIQPNHHSSYDLHALARKNTSPISAHSTPNLSGLVGGGGGGGAGVGGGGNLGATASNVGGGGTGIVGSTSSHHLQRSFFVPCHFLDKFTKTQLWNQLIIDWQQMRSEFFVCFCVCVCVCVCVCDLCVYVRFVGVHTFV